MITLVPRTHGRPITDHSIAHPAASAGRSWLTRLLAGEFELPVVAPAALPRPNAAPAERAAIARALACPDLFILDAPDRTVRERLIANCLRLAAERGERVLALSPDAAAADRIVEALAAECSSKVVRALADDENPQRVGAAAIRLSSRQQGAGRAEQLRREAALAISTLEAKLSRLERTRTLRTRREEIDRQRSSLAAELESLHDPASLENRGEPDASALRERLEAIRGRRDAVLAPLAAERAVLASKRTEKEAAFQAALTNAGSVPKKSGFFARLFGAHPSGTPDKSQIAALETEVQSLANSDTALAAAIETAAQPFLDEIATSLREAAAIRRAALEKTQRELEAEAARIDHSLREFQPRAAADDTVENGVSYSSRRGELERELAAARTRHDELTHAGSDLGRRLLAETQIVVGTPGSLGADPVFKAFGAAPAFGLLVLDHAEELTEADFEALAALANRCVLVGDAALPEEPRSHLNGHAPRRTHEPTLLARLARRLDAEPWAVEGDRLVFRLVPLAPEKRKSLAREPVLDHPHVELRVAGDGADPILAEIAFPANTSVVQAKSFLFTQLGEVLLRPCGEKIWQASAERFIASWPLLDSEGGDWVELEPGVRELVRGCGPMAFTAAISFDRSSWTEEQAEAWLAEHAPQASPSRLAVLPRPTSSRCFA